MVCLGVPTWGAAEWKSKPHLLPPAMDGTKGGLSRGLSKVDQALSLAVSKLPALSSKNAAHKPKCHRTPELSVGTRGETWGHDISEGKGAGGGAIEDGPRGLVNPCMPSSATQGARVQSLRLHP